MLEGWLDQGISPADVVVVEPSQPALAAGVTVVADQSGVPAAFAPDVVVLAVKPQMMDGVAPAYGRYRQAVFLSIAAGKTLAYFAQHLGEGAAIVRVMPNTPAAVRCGMSVAVANAHVSAEQRRLCGELLSSVGEVAWIDNEALMDPVTAVSGSGPAYVFLLAEVMAQAGIAAGLPEELATRLARATVAGSGELLRQSVEAAGQLRQNVTSPGGTTFAALQVLMGDDGMGPLMTRAVRAASDRSRELAG